MIRLNLLVLYHDLKKDLDIKYKYCFLISGPEPQRTILENIKERIRKDKRKSL